MYTHTHKRKVGGTHARTMSTDFDCMWSEFDAMRIQSPLSCVQYTKTSLHVCKCGGSKVLNEDEIPTCKSCGISDSVYITDTAEWVSGVDETGKVSDPSRCGAPQDLELFSEKWGSSTVIVKSGKATYASRRLAKINFHISMNHRDRALFHAYKDIDAAAKTHLNIPDSVVRVAKIFYRKFNETKLTRGAIRTGIKANCLLHACKLSGVPRTTKEVADAYGIPTKDVSRTADLFKEVMCEVSGAPQNEPKIIIITKPVDVIPRLLSMFSVPGSHRKIVMQCNKICEKLDKCVELMGKTPTSVASVVILVVIECTKQEICKNCKISMPTLNKIETIVKTYLGV